jgi:serine protease SohB
VANHIIAAPFSIIGSIGVLAQIPNLHRFLKKHEVDFEQLSAGEFKRTLTLFGENTEKGREKMQQELEETHQLFKDFIAARRPGLDLSAVATGEHWLGTRALELGLVDALSTSDDYLMNARNDHDLIKVEYSRRKNLQERIGEMFSRVGSNRRQEIRDLESPLLM